MINEVIVEKIKELLQKIEELNQFSLTNDYGFVNMNITENGDYLDRNNVLSIITNYIDTLKEECKEIENIKDWIVRISKKSDIGIRTVMILDNHDELHIFGINSDDFDRFSKEMSYELIRIKYEEDQEK